MTGWKAESGSAPARGATWDGSGVTFSVFSAHAERVELCLLDAAGEERVELRRTGDDWHCHRVGIGPGQRYGYRVTGPYDAASGHRFDPSKLLLDPYAKAVDGVVEAGADRAAASVVVDPAFAWDTDRPPDTPWDETVVYELHVKGFTARHPDVAPGQRGTFAGLASEPVIDHLRRLGVTAVELLPVHHIADEELVRRNGLVNYWGYSSIGYFAPHAPYAATGRSGQQVTEFKAMVRDLHAAGIEVLLDVVYNHTAEGGDGGPTLSFRGVDNRSYYRLEPGAPDRYLDFSGTGNSLDVSHPEVARLVLDSLRYWVTDCHVDGFRFDLATSLARTQHDIDWAASFLAGVHRDPVLSGVKLIAEPWDLGPDGYQLGRFPDPWSEWNGVFRDDVRDFWRGRAGAARLAARLTGSSDLYGSGDRGPRASVNFVTAHDGFTLSDLVAYEAKHNEANGEGNRDGSDDNRSWNCGVEGPTTDPAVRRLRRRQRRNLLATLLLSAGTPMVLAGDEMGRTQGGNNNAWCQDNEVSWVDWALDDDERDHLAFTTRLLDLRRAHPAFRRRDFIGDGPASATGPGEAAWFRADGAEMGAGDWDEPDRRVLGLFLNGAGLPASGAEGTPTHAGSFLVLCNGGGTDETFTLPSERFGRRWSVELTTADPELEAMVVASSPGERVAVQGRSLTVLRRADPA